MKLNIQQILFIYLVVILLNAFILKEWNEIFGFIKKSLAIKILSYAIPIGVMWMVAVMAFLMTAISCVFWIPYLIGVILFSLGG